MLLSFGGTKLSAGTGEIKMRDSLNELKLCEQAFDAEELREQLEQEKGTARRQELLKALWKLSQERKPIESTVIESTSAQLTAMASDASRTLATSC
jgi:hypothetical protein